MGGTNSKYHELWKFHQNVQHLLQKQKQNSFSGYNPTKSQHGNKLSPERSNKGSIILSIVKAN